MVVVERYSAQFQHTVHSEAVRGGVIGLEMTQMQEPMLIKQTLMKASDFFIHYNVKILDLNIIFLQQEKITVDVITKWPGYGQQYSREKKGTHFCQGMLRLVYYGSVCSYEQGPGARNM